VLSKSINGALSAWLRSQSDPRVDGRFSNTTVESLGDEQAADAASLLKPESAEGGVAEREGLTTASLATTSGRAASQLSGKSHVRMQCGRVQGEGEGRERKGW
jgi:hypothetical protein